MLLFILLIYLYASSPVFPWMINEDYQQRDSRPATDFDIWLVGDVRDQIDSSFSKMGCTNPFENPNITMQLTEIGNTKIRFKGSNTIPQDPNAQRHFGIASSGRKPRGRKPQVRFKAWSYASDPFYVPVPKSNFAFIYDPDNWELTISVENLSDDTVTFSEVGYLLNSEEQPIENLSRDILPPEMFISLHELNKEYKVGESASIVIQDVDPSEFAITYATVTFSGESINNRYNEYDIGSGGEWTQVAVIDEIGNADIDILPVSNSFGNIKVGKSSDQMIITIFNKGDGILNILDIALSDETNFSLDVNAGPNPCKSKTSIISPDGCCKTFGVIFTPSSQGSKTATITITSNDPDAPDTTVFLSGYGKKPTNHNLTMRWGPSCFNWLSYYTYPYLGWYPSFNIRPYYIDLNYLGGWELYLDNWYTLNSFWNIPLIY